MCLNEREKDFIIKLGNKEVVISICWAEKNLQKTIWEQLIRKNYVRSFPNTWHPCKCDVIVKYCCVRLLELFHFLKCLFFYFFLIYIYLLKHCWLTMFQVHSKVIQLYIYIYIIFEIIFHYRLLQDINYSCLWSTVNLCYLLHFLN